MIDKLALGMENKFKGQMRQMMDEAQSQNENMMIEAHSQKEYMMEAMMKKMDMVCSGSGPLLEAMKPKVSPLFSPAKSESSTISKYQTGYKKEEGVESSCCVSVQGNSKAKMNCKIKMEALTSQQFSSIALSIKELFKSTYQSQYERSATSYGASAAG